MATKSKKSGSKKRERTPAQKAATRRMLAANKAAKKARASSGAKSRAAKKSAARKGKTPPPSIGARVSRLESQVDGLRQDVDAHTELFSFLAKNSRGLFSASGSARQLGAGR